MMTELVHTRSRALPLHPVGDPYRRYDSASMDRYGRPELDGPAHDVSYHMPSFAVAEDRDLIRGLQDGLTVAEIALDLGRRQSDIDARLRRLLSHQPLRDALRAVAVPPRVPEGRFFQAGVSTPDQDGGAPDAH